MNSYKIFWGEAHDNTYQSDNSPRDNLWPALERARSHLDFYAAAYYLGGWQAGPVLQGGCRIGLEGWKPQERYEREWGEVQRATAECNDPGAFVTFPGYEWQGDGSSGDHNVFSRNEGLPIFHVDKLADLYAALRDHDAIAIPHHTWYRPGVRGRDWSVYDERLSPFSEVYSAHGSSETDEEWVRMRVNSHMGPGFGGGNYQAALDRGYRIGAICSTDNNGEMPGHYNHGSMACLAPELTRDALWEAFRSRRVYGVTGDRIAVDFQLDDQPMGSMLKASGARRIQVAVTGCDALDRIEILRNGQVIHTQCHQGTWQFPGTRSRFKMRIECGWGARDAVVPVMTREWAGRLTVDGGQMLGADPCWISPQTTLPDLRQDTAVFQLRTSTANVGEPVQNAFNFEFEADPAAAMRLELNGLQETGTVAEFAAESREIWYKDECIAMLKEKVGMAPGSPERNDIYHHLAFKAKLHRTMPAAAYTAELEFEDDTPLTAEANYRVRIEQRNGQRAWTSPIWVTA